MSHDFQLILLLMWLESVFIHASRYFYANRAPVSVNRLPNQRNRRAARNSPRCGVVRCSNDFSHSTFYGRPVRMRRNRPLVPVLFSLLSAISAARADIKLHGLFNDNMVLQRDIAVPV